jgi:hypothetical protein
MLVQNEQKKKGTDEAEALFDREDLFPCIAILAAADTMV